VIAVGAIAPIRSLAQWGLQRDERQKLQKQWELADLWRAAPQSE